MSHYDEQREEWNSQYRERDEKAYKQREEKKMTEFRKMYRKLRREGKLDKVEAAYVLCGK